MKRYKRAASLGWCHILIPSQRVIGAADEDVGLAVVVSTGGHSFLAIDSLCCCAGKNSSNYLLVGGFKYTFLYFHQYMEE